MLLNSHRFGGGASGGPPSVGDYWTGEGGFYAGTVVYGDTREFHLILADASTDIIGEQWKTTSTTTSGAGDADDGKANTEAMIAAGSHPVAIEVASLTIDGHSDFYLPSWTEFFALRSALKPLGPWDDGNAQGFESVYYWGSLDLTASAAFAMEFNSGSYAWATKTETNKNARAIRRVAV